MPRPHLVAAAAAATLAAAGAVAATMMTGAAGSWASAADQSADSSSSRTASQAAPTTAGAAAGSPMSIDGGFDDWIGTDPIVRDARDAPGSEVDILAVRARADGRHLHLQFDTVDAACLQGLARPLELLLDADGDAGSGAPTALLPGLDVVIAFSPADARRPDRPGQAVGLEIFGIDARQAPNAYALDLHFAPSHAATRFEVRLERGRDLPGVGTVLAGPRVTGRLVQRTANGTILELTEPFTVDLPTLDRMPPTTGVSAGDDPLDRPDGRLRVMSWNAERGAIVKQMGASGRLMAATTPDILLLQELPEDTPATSVQRILESATGDSWTVHVGRGGGNLRSAVATRLPAAMVTELDPLPLPDVPNRDIRTAAQLIEHEGGRVLALSIHLKCCGRPGDSSDQRRIAEAEAIRDAMARVIGDLEPDAVVIAGDFNLVGTRSPLDILLRGLDIDGSELLAVDARQPAPGATNATWYDEDSPFTPGRLDFVLVSDRTLAPRQALVLNGLHMGGEAWTQRGLRPEDTLISDHFPIIVDLDWSRGE